EHALTMRYRTRCPGAGELDLPGDVLVRRPLGRQSFLVTGSRAPWTTKLLPIRRVCGTDSGNEHQKRREADETVHRQDPPECKKLIARANDFQFTLLTSNGTGEFPQVFGKRSSWMSFYGGETEVDEAEGSSSDSLWRAFSGVNCRSFFAVGPM